MGEEGEKVLPITIIISMVIFSVVFVLGFAGNGLVIFIIAFRMKKTVNTIWFLSLAVADFSFIIFLPLRIAYLSMGSKWHFGEPLCKLNSTIALFNLYASIYHLVVISIDSCISIWCPLWAQNHQTPRLASFVVVGIWLLALLLCSPNFYFRELKDNTICRLNYDNDPEENKIIHRAVASLQFIFAFDIPFTVITFCYGAFVLRLRRMKLPLSSKPFKAITAVIVVFFVLCFPFHVFSFLETKAEKIPPSKEVLNIGIPLMFSLVYFNSCLNPILYFFVGWDSKENLKRSLHCAVQNALAEESSLNTTQTKPSLSTEFHYSCLSFHQKFAWLPHLPSNSTQTTTFIKVIPCPVSSLATGQNNEKHKTKPAQKVFTVS